MQPDYERAGEVSRSKLDVAIEMIRRAWGHSTLRAQYVLCDSRFTCESLVSEVKEIGHGALRLVGDQNMVEGDADYPLGHPQLAQVAIQQAINVAENLMRINRNKQPRPFTYRNLGTMATIGRKRAVAEIGRFKFGGLSAWLLWLVVHLRSILGVKNKTVIFLNWMWNYFNYKQSLRLILKSECKTIETNKK